MRSELIEVFTVRYNEKSGDYQQINKHYVNINYIVRIYPIGYADVIEMIERKPHRTRIIEIQDTHHVTKVCIDDANYKKLIG